MTDDGLSVASPISRGLTGLLSFLPLPCLDFSPRGLTIRQRLAVVVASVLLPSLLLSAVVIERLADSKREASRQAILYAAQSIRTAVDARLGKYAAVGQVLADSPSLQANDLVSFRSEAERAIKGLPGAWVTLADPAGQQVVNTLVPVGAPLPLLTPEPIPTELRAFETGQIQTTNVVIGPIAKAPVVGVGVPIFRAGEPAYFLLVGVRADTFRDLLNDSRVPEGWLTAIVDQTGVFVARSRDHDRFVGKPTSAGWRSNLSLNGLVDYVSLDGQYLTHANAVSELSGWAIGVATERNTFEAPLRKTIVLAALASLAVMLASVLLAAWAAQRLTTSVKGLETGAEMLRRRCRLPVRMTGVPEVDTALSAFDKAAEDLITREAALTASEHRIRLAQDAAHAGAWEWTQADGRYHWSERLWSLYGLSPDQCEASFDTWARSVHPEHRVRIVQEVRAAWLANQEFEVQWRVNLPPGSPERWLLARGRPLFGPDGALDRYTGIAIDVTERVRVEQALRESDRRIAAILESLPVGVALVDPHRHILVGNATFRRFVPDVVPSAEGGHPELWEGYDENGRRLTPSDYPTARALRGELVWPGLEFLFHGNDRQERRWVRIAAAPFRDEQGAITGAIPVIVDIDEEKRVHEERRLLQAELLHVSRLSEMGQMAAALAHELNQPLTAIAVYVGGCKRLLAHFGNEAERRQQTLTLIQSINDQALRAGEIIRHLRDFVGKGETGRTLESAAKIMREASALALISAKRKGVTVRFAFAEVGMVLVNRVQIQQVVFNLMRNAIEAMETCPRKDLDLELATDGTSVVIRIGDTGTGIAAEIAGRLFMPFSSTKRDGMGIGLSVCRNIIEAHKGRIWAEPKPDGGTEFCFSLPLVEPGSLLDSDDPDELLGVANA